MARLPMSGYYCWNWRQSCGSMPRVLLSVAVYYLEWETEAFYDFEVATFCLVTCLYC